MPRSIAIPALLSATTAIAFLLLGPGMLGFTASTALKGSTVAILAFAAAQQARNVDGWLLASVMALGALGDVLIEFAMLAGAAAFAVGHATAIALYLRNRRPRGSMPASQKAAAVALLLSPIVLYGLAGSKAEAGVAIYAALLALMAACAWTSRFSRYRTGIGAVLFLVSDAFIMARLGGRIDPNLAGWLIWPLYAAGQILIFIGVQTVLTPRRA